MKRKISVKRKILCVIFALLLAADMIFIFYNSSETADKSGSRSGEFTQLVVSIFYRGYDALSDAEKEAVVLRANGVIRELAHLAEFVPFGIFLSALLFAVYLPKGRKLGRLSLAGFGSGALYALSDEVHQIFVAGRGFQFFDIFMDSCGVALGVIIALIVYDIAVMRVEKKNRL